MSRTPSTSSPLSTEDERNALRVYLAVPGCPPGATLGMIAVDARVALAVAQEHLDELVRRGRVVRCKRSIGWRESWHYYHAAPVIRPQLSDV